MYYRYFGLSEAPFSIAPNPQYLYMSPHHRDALAHLLYGVGVGGGFILLTGEVGTGKTTITRCLLEQLPDNIDLAMVLNPALNAQELLATACDELGIENDTSDTLKTLTDKLHRFLLSNHAQGRNTVLLIDEAQHLQTEVLEQVRLLTNLETNTKKLLQIVLVGQPELNAILARPELRQLNQRITARYKIQPLGLEETGAYIHHRLQVAGLPGGQELFPASVIRGIFQKTGGLPRLINLLCDRVLMGTYGQNKTHIDQQVFKQAVAEVLGDERRAGPDSVQRWLLSGSCVFIIIAGLLVWNWYNGLAVSPLASAPPSHTVEQKPGMLAAQGGAGAGIQGETNVTPVSAMDSAERSTEDVFESQVEAYQLLSNEMNLGFSLDPKRCAPPGLAWRCDEVQLNTWEAAQDYNRPAILRLITPGRQSAYAVLAGISAGMATIVGGSGVQRYALEELGAHWDGSAVILWKPPRGFGGPVGLWDQGEVVSWLAQSFAQLDGESLPLADTTFNQQLQQRVMLFQRQSGLVPDGVVGMQTLLRLNEVLGLAQTLATAGDVNANGVTSQKVD